MADIDYDRLSEAIVEALNRAGPSSDATKTAEEVRARQKSIDALLKQTKEIKESNGALNTLGRAFSGQRARSVDVTKELEALDDQLKKTTKLDERTELIKRRREVEQAAAYRNVSVAFSNAGIAVVKFTAKLGETIAQAGGDLVRSLQRNGTGIEMAAGLMTAGLSGVNMVGQAAASGLTGLGQAALGAKSSLLKFGGVALIAAGTTVGFVSDKLTRLAKFGIEILTTEVLKNINAFKLISGAGAGFAGGMDEIRRYALIAGVDVEQFAHAVKNNTGALSESGLTVSDGSKKMAFVTNQFARMTGRSGQTLQKEMLNLGFGFQEQAELSAQILADLKRTGATATNEQMAFAARDLAKNMRIVADITGQDAKQKMDQAKKMSEQYAFFAEVNRIAKQTNDPGLPQRVRASLALMDETQQRAAIQSVVLNGVVTDVSANIYGMADPAREFNRVLRAGNAGVKELTTGFYQASQDFEKNSGETAKAISIANIASGQLSDLAKAADIRGQSALYQDPKNLLRAEQNSEAAAAATGQLHNAVIDAEKEVQRMRLMIQDMITSALGRFAEVAKESMVLMREGIEALKKSGVIKSAFGGEDKKEGEKKGPTPMERVETAATGGIIGTIVGQVIGALVGAGVGFFGGAGVGAVPAAAVGSKIGGAVGGGAGLAIGAFWENIKGWFSDNTAKKALGGYTEPGKLNIAGEQDVEAIVPLPGNRKIPVDLKYTDTGGRIPQENFLEPIKDVYNGLITSTSTLQSIISSGSMSMGEMIGTLSKFKDIDSTLDKIGNLDQGILQLAQNLESLNLVTVKSLRDIADLSENNYTSRLDANRIEPLSQVLEKLSKGIDRSNTASRSMTSLVDKPKNIVETDIDTDSGVETLVDQNEKFNQSLQIQLSELINDLKTTAEASVAKKTEPESAMVSNLNENLVNTLKNTLIQGNEALKNILQEQNEILRTNTSKIEDLASATNYGADYTRRLYNEST